MYSNGYKILLENYDFQDNTYIACYYIIIIWVKYYSITKTKW